MTEAPAGREHHLYYPPPGGPISLDQTTEADRKALARLVADKRACAEIGTFLGGTAETMLEAMPADGWLLSLDTFEGMAGEVTAKIPGDKMLLYAAERLARFGRRVRLVRGHSLDLAAIQRPHSLDFVFIDGAHDYASVRADIGAWLPLVRPGGLLAGHDLDKAGLDIQAGDDEEARRRAAACRERQVGEDWIHWGVVEAVSEAFSQIAVSEDDASTIWWARPEWRKHDVAA